MTGVTFIWMSVTAARICEAGVVLDRPQLAEEALADVPHLLL